jgi:hypothetical protein
LAKVHRTFASASLGFSQGECPNGEIPIGEVPATPQSGLFERLKKDSDHRKIVVQVDYSENFPLNYQDAVQSAHWNIKTLSILHRMYGVKQIAFHLH